MIDAIRAGLDRLREFFTVEPLGMEAELATDSDGDARLSVRRAGRTFELTYSCARGFEVGESNLHHRLVDPNRNCFQEFANAAEQLQILVLSAPKYESSLPCLSLLVLQSADIQAAKNFYSLLGLSFVEEQHGTGPRHYSANIGTLVLEIYPTEENKTHAPVRIGFRVSSLDGALEKLRKSGARILREAKESPWGRRAVVQDPDGNRVELT